MFKKIINFLVGLVLVPICVVCRRRSSFLCSGCRSKIKINDSLACAECGARLPENKKICHPSSFILGSAGSYQNDILRELIAGLKYKGFKAAAPILAELLYEYLNKTGLNFADSAIVPIPLHKSRERKRGFNQSVLVAEELAKITGSQVLSLLKRVANTKSQTEFSEKEKRLANVAGCFSLSLTASDAVNLGKVILLDDVFTSGATMKEAVKTLKACGVKKIIGLVAAKA